jgi:hypothetical protein
MERGLKFDDAAVWRNTFPLLRYAGGGLGWGFLESHSTKTPTLALPRITGGGERSSLFRFLPGLFTKLFPHFGGFVEPFPQPFAIAGFQHRQDFLQFLLESAD